VYTPKIMSRDSFLIHSASFALAIYHVADCRRSLQLDHNL
jgi:hypothetical protein